MAVTIVDTKLCNLTSVVNAFKHLGVKTNVTSNYKDISSCDRLILPGVGAFDSAIDKLKISGMLDQVLEHTTYQQKPLLGICLGMQILATEGSEGRGGSGLDIIPGKVNRLPDQMENFNVPHIGWAEVTSVKDGLFHGIAQNSSFYHIHSYYFECKTIDTQVATINFANKLISVSIRKDNVFGVQFHPEKSHVAGLKILQNFADYR